MKRILSCLSVALCVILATVALAACSSNSKWLRPEFTYEGEELTVEFVNNMEEDFKFPIEGLKFDHSKFADEGLLEYGWVIYNAERELVGWIEAGGGYESDKSGNYQYGYSASYNNDVYCYSNSSICLVLKTTDLTVFDNVKFSSDHGSVSKANAVGDNPFKASVRYNHYNETTNEIVPDAGSEKFVCCFYDLIIEDIDTNGPQTINISFSLKEE